MEKNMTYNEEDAFFSIVNNHKMQCDIDKATLARVKNLYPFIERGVEASINDAEYEIEYERQVERNKRDNKKVILSLLAAATILVSSVSIAGRAAVDHLKINVTSQIGIENMEKMLIASDCAYQYEIGDEYNKKYQFVVKDNSVEDYSRLSVTDITDIYHMKSILSDEEFKEFIKSRTYVDEATGMLMNYENFTHFLYVNGFKNESEFNNVARDALLVQYNEEEVRLNYNNVNVDYVPTSRGGK